MEILKKIARKILVDKESRKTTEDILREMYTKLKENTENKEREYKDKIQTLELDKTNMERKLEELEKENEILRQYYDLDKEPSDEIKAKMHIDLEINRLKEEMMKMLVMQSRQPIYYMPPSYPFGRGF